MTLDKEERALMEKVRKANRFSKNGDPIKDAIDDHEIVEALVLLEDVVFRLEGLDK